MTAEEYKEQEALLAKAVDAYNRDKNQKISPLARKYGVDRRTLKRRIDGKASRSTRSHANQILTPDQEKALFWWIQYLDRIGAPPTTQQITYNANLMLSKHHSGSGEPPSVGKNWVYRFIDRLPENYKRVVQKPQEVDRSDAESRDEIEMWFNNLSNMIQEFGVGPENLWNFDETGFVIGQGKKEAVVTAHIRSAKRIASNSSRESITIVECVNAEGKVIPPLIIPKGERHMEEWYNHIKDDDWLIAPAANGFITDEIAFEWLQHFNIHTMNKYWRILFMDNHKTHATYEFLEYCEQECIQVVNFPAHSTHLLQPLDGIPFQQYKQFHGKAVNNLSRLGNFKFDKNDFFEALGHIREQTFTPRVIRHGWKDRGIWPWNPNIVLDQIPEVEAVIDDGDILKIYGGELDGDIPSSPTHKSISPPSTVQKLRRYIKKIDRSIEGIKDILDEASPGLARRINTINQGSLALAELGDMHRDDFARIRNINNRKNQRKTKRQIKHFGALQRGEANRMIKRRHEGDLLRLHKKHILGVPEPGDKEPLETLPTSGFFLDSQGNK